MASKVSTPYMPRLEMLKFPLLNSSGLSCLLRARLTRSAQFLRQQAVGAVLWVWHSMALCGALSCVVHA